MDNWYLAKMARTRLLLITSVVALAGCGSEIADSSTPSSSQIGDRAAANDAIGEASAPDLASLAALALELREEIAARDVAPIPAAPAVRPALVELGQSLAFDKVLSGNRNISCMTCHHSDLATGDARHLPLGEGAVNLGPAREGGHIIPRNAPALFNLHAFETMFWDSRVAINAHGDLITPAGAEMTAAMVDTFEFGVVSAQAMFPVTSREEMRGLAGSNELADAPTFTAIWQGLMARIGEIPAYRSMFEAAYPGQSFENMTFAHAANAIAGFEVAAFEFHESPWERFLNGDDTALTVNQVRGGLDYFRQGCHDCHSGPAFSDFSHHNTALAQFGPGKGDGATHTDDFGHMRVSGLASDKYKFRTPSLVNIELTGPYGHDGQYASLSAFIGHYDNVEQQLLKYKVSQNVDRNESALWNLVQANTNQILSSVDPDARDLGKFNAVHMTSFLQSLTDPRARNLDHTIPATVPSGLPVAD
jgi:cytochrome c peroxidase